MELDPANEARNLGIWVWATRNDYIKQQTQDILVGQAGCYLLEIDSPQNCRIGSPNKIRCMETKNKDFPCEQRPKSW